MKNVFFAVLLFVPGLLFAQADKFSIKGKIGNLNKPAMAYLTYRSGDQSIRDSSTLVNGVFEFHYKISYPVEATLWIIPDGKTSRSIPYSNQLTFYLEPKNMEMTESDSARSAKVKNSLINEEAAELNRELAPVAGERRQLYNDFEKLTPEQQKSGSLKDEIMKKMEVNQNKWNDVEKAFVVSHPKSLASLKAIQDVVGPIPDADQGLPLLNKLDPIVKNSVPGKKYIEYLTSLAVVGIGKIAPEFSQPDTSGKTISLSSFRGKYVLIDFWASWCGPCRAENPNVLAAYNKYHPKGLEILAVSLDNDRPNWVKAILQDKLPWAQVSDLKYWKSEVAELYRIRAIPQNFLISPDGKIVAKNLRDEALGTKLEEVLGKTK